MAIMISNLNERMTEIRKKMKKLFKGEKTTEKVDARKQNIPLCKCKITFYMLLFGIVRKACISMLKYAMKILVTQG